MGKRGNQRREKMWGLWRLGMIVGIESAPEGVEKREGSTGRVDVDRSCVR